MPNKKSIKKIGAFVLIAFLIAVVLFFGNYMYDGFLLFKGIVKYEKEQIVKGEKEKQTLRSIHFLNKKKEPFTRMELQAANFRGTYYLEGLTHQKKVALTFDDGPSQASREIASVLKEYNIKATFFHLGGNVKASPEITKQLFEEGHTIGNHSFSHPFIYRRKNIIPFKSKQFDKTQEIIHQVIGEYPALFARHMDIFHQLK